MTMRHDGSVFTFGGSWYALGTTIGNKFGELWDPKSPDTWQLKSGINTVGSVITNDPDLMFEDNHMVSEQRNPLKGTVRSTCLGSVAIRSIK